MVDSMDPYDLIFFIPVLIISHPFAVRALLTKFISDDETLQCDLGMGRNWQARDLTLNNLNRLPPYAACPVQFGLSKARPFDTGSEKQQRVGTHHRNDGAGLPSPRVLLLDDASVVRRRHPNTDAVLIEHL